jgi:ABC-2 type transport system ATP-binding protein
VIEVRNLTYRYGKSIAPALSDVSFVVQPGAMCVFLAPNGGGKTTLFKILSTAFPLQEGAILYDGKDFSENYSIIRKSIGVVFQNPSVDKRLTVRENLHCQAYLYGGTPKRMRGDIERVVGLFGLEPHLGHTLETLSGGFQRRVEIAKCVLHTPPVLLLDEPSTGLDIVSRKELWEYLALLRERDGTTILATTHLTDEAEQSGQVIILNGGRLVVSGNPVELKNQIGGEILSIGTRDAASLLSLLSDKWNIRGTHINGRVRLELSGNELIVPQLLSDYRNLVDTITISRPSLADVFFRYTGSRFDETRNGGEV